MSDDEEDAAPWIETGVLRIARLAQEGALRSGDIVATRKLGDCTVSYVVSASEIVVQQRSTGQHFRLQGIAIPGARVSERQS